MTSKHGNLKSLCWLSVIEASSHWDFMKKRLTIWTSKGNKKKLKKIKEEAYNLESTSSTIQIHLVMHKKL